MNRRAAITALAACICALAAASCAVKPPAVESPVAAPASFSRTGDALLEERWWTALGDERLNGLVEDALAGNFGLKSAFDRVQQARAIARQQGARLAPQLDGSASAGRSAARQGTPGGTRTTYQDELSMGLSAGYEVDLWGRLRAARDAARLDAEANGEDLTAAAISLSAQVAETWYRLAERRGQLRLLDEQIETTQKYLDIITLKFRRGHVPAADVLQQRQVIESRRGERALVESNIGVLESQLAVLLGDVPGAFSVPEGLDLADLPPAPETGLPAALVRRRPDVRAAERRMEAASHRVAVAVADRFPRLQITARGETSAEEVGQLFDNWLANLLGNLSAPLLDGGSREAEVDRTQAVLSERVNAYGQTVLDALKEVEDALVREARQQDYLASLRQQLELSGESIEQTRDRYIRGTADFTRYLTTLLDHQRLQRTYLTARLDEVLFRIGLYRALAGGWDAVPRKPEVETERLQTGEPN